MTTPEALPLDSGRALPCTREGSSTLWTPFRAIELVTTAYSARVFIQRTFGSKKKQYPKSMRVATEGVKGQRPLGHFFFNISRFVK